MNYGFTRTGPEIEAIHNTVSSLPDSISGYSQLVFSDIENLKLGVLNDGTSIDIPSLTEGVKVNWLGYYSRSDGGSNWGVVRFGAHTEDGGSVFSIDANTYIEANLKGKYINPLKFGAKNDSSFNSSPFVDNLIAHLNSLSEPRGIMFSEGNYNIKAGLSNNIIKDNTTVCGKNAIIHCEAVNTFVFGDAGFATRPRKVYAKGLEFKFENPTLNEDARPLKFYNVIFGGIEDIVSDNCPAVYELVGKDSNSRVSNFTVKNIKGNTANVPHPAQRIKNSSVINLYDIVLLNNIPLPPDDTTTLSTAVFGNSFLSLENDLDTLYGNNLVGNRYERTLTGGAGIGESQLNVELDRLIADYSASFAVRIVNDGSMGNWIFNDPYLRGSDGKGFYWETTANGTTNNIHIEKPYTIMCGNDGILFTSTLEARCDDIAINDPRSVACNRLQNGGDDIVIERCRVDVNDGYVGKTSSGIVNVIGGPVQGENGISISNDTEIYSVKGLRAGGTVSSYELPSHVSGSRDRLVTDNRVLVGSSVLDRPEYARFINTPIPASGVPYTNVHGYDINISLRSSSGTPSQPATINIDGIVVHNTTDYQCVLRAGQTITVTYTTAMAWVLIGVA